jgi:hypothetical protein
MCALLRGAAQVRDDSGCVPRSARRMQVDRPRYHLPASRRAAPIPPRLEARPSSQRRAPLPANCGGNAQTCADSDENTAEERRSHAACGHTWRVILTATPRANEFQTSPTASCRPRRPKNHLDFAGQHPFNDRIGSLLGAGRLLTPNASANLPSAACFVRVSGRATRHRSAATATAWGVWGQAQTSVGACRREAELPGSLATLAGMCVGRGDSP